MMLSQPDKREYWGLDTETYRGRAFLLSYAEGVVNVNSFEEIFQALVSLKISKAMFFNIDYDVTAILAHLPEATCKRLYMSKHVVYKDYHIEYLTGKFFSIRRGRKKFVAYDLFPFFQIGLDASAKKIGLEVGKNELSLALLRDLSPGNYRKHKDLVDSYARQDAILTQHLADFIVGAVKNIGLSTQRLYSPGFLAKQYLRKQNARCGGVPKDFRSFIRSTYHGGRIEVFQRGAFRKLWVYDIKSSYPACIRQLPDISNARIWVSSEPESTFYFVQARVWDNSDLPLLPHKHNGLTVFPKRNGEECFLTGAECDYLRDLGNRIEILSCLNFGTKTGKPFKKIVDTLFKLRASGGGEGLLYKLILNSMYGVFAETIKNYSSADTLGVCRQLERMQRNAFRDKVVGVMGQKCPDARRYWLRECSCDYCNDTRLLLRTYRNRLQEKPLFYSSNDFWYAWRKDGRFANIAYASYITAMARIALHREMIRHSKRLVAVFTDSLLLSARSPFLQDSGAKLGEFELKESGRGLVIGSGVYQVGDMTKFRGFHIRESLIDILTKNLRKDVFAVPQTRRNSLGVLVRRGFENDEFLNGIFDDEKLLDLNFDAKRVWARSFSNCADALRNRITSAPFSLADLE